MGKLNNLEALQGPAKGQKDNDETVSVSVRRISNGYVKSTSRYGAGNYECSEEFSEDKPSLSPVQENRGSGAGNFRGAVDYLKRG